jgi:nitrate reductase NapAB chaperone NapD
MKQTKKRFKAREGAPFKKQDAQRVGEELDSIRKEEGILNPSLVVKHASKKGSFLNKYFEWDNSRAGEQWRLQQARNIVNHVIEVIIIRGEETEVRDFVNVVVEDGSTQYVPFKEALVIESYKQQLLREMETTLENLLNMIKILREQ